MRIEKLTGAFTTSTGTQSIAYDAATYGGDPVCTWGRIYTNTSFGATNEENGWITFFYDGTTLATTFGHFSGGALLRDCQRGVNVASALMDNGVGTTLVDASLSYDTTDNDLDFVFTTIAGAFYYEIYNAYGSDVLSLSGYDDGTGNQITTNWGVPPKFVLSAGASTSSSTTPNGAANWGASDGTNYGGVRIGQKDGSTVFFARHMSNASAMNIFDLTSYGLIAPNNFQNNSFDLAFSDPNSNDAGEQTIYLAVYCDNPVELLSNQTLTDKATNATEGITVSHEPEYLIAGGGVDVAAADTLYNNTNGVNVFHGFADLSAGAGASADYFASRFVWKRNFPIYGQLELTDAYLLFGIDIYDTAEDFEATVSAKSSSSITISKDLGDSAARFWLLNIGAEPASSNPETTVADATAAGVDGSARTLSATADATTVGLDASARTLSAVADATCAGLDATPRVVSSVADATAEALDGLPRVSTEVATAVAAGLDAVPRVRTALADATAAGVDASARTTSAAADATAAGLDATPRVRTAIADAVAVGLDAEPGGGFPTSTDWYETDYDNALTFADLFNNETFNGFPATSSTPSDYNAHSHYGDPQAATWSEYTLSGRMYRTSATVGLGVTVYSDYPNSDVYYRLRINGYASSWDLNAHGASISDTYSGPNPTSNEVSFKIQVLAESGQNRVRAKVWDSDGSEPGTWNLEAVDTAVDRPIAGTVGLWVGQNPVDPATEKAYWYDLKVDLGDGNGFQTVPLQSSLPVTELADCTASALDAEVNPVTSVASAVADAIDGYTNVTEVANAVAEALDGSSSATTYVSSISRHGITWTFDQPYPAGQYASGDWWVSAPLVRITGITPESILSGSRYMHGSMKNLQPRSASQGFDSTTLGGPSGWTTTYDNALNVAWGVSPGSPLELVAGDSLVSVESRETIGAAGGAVQQSAGGVAIFKTAAVLTIVSQPPADGSLRPPYCTATDTPYRVSDADLAKLTEAFPTTASTTATSDPYVQSVMDGRLHLEWIAFWWSRYTHPVDTMPEYGRDMMNGLSEMHLMMHSDMPLEQKLPILYGLLQIGIDWDGLYAKGMAWSADGGHMQGRKWPIMFKRAMFNETTDLSDSNTAFQENDQTHYVEETSPGVYNFGYGGYDASHVGMPEWAFRHYSASPQGDLNNLSLTADPYRLCCTTNVWHATALCAYVMGLRGDWGHEPFFDYIDRYRQTFGAASNQFGSITWPRETWDTYRASFAEYPVAPLEPGWPNGPAQPITEIANAVTAGLDASISSVPTTTLADATAAALDATPAGATEIATATAAALDATPRVRTQSADATAVALDATPRVRTQLADATAVGLDATLPTANPTTVLADATAASLDAIARTLTAPATATAVGLDAGARTVTTVAVAVAAALDARNRSTDAPAVAVAVALDGTPLFSQSVRERVIAAIIEKLNAISPVGYEREAGDWAFRLRLDDVQYPNPFIFVSVASEAKRETSHHYDCELEVEITAFLSTSSGAGDAVLDQIVSDVESVVMANPQWSSTAIDTELAGHERGRLDQPRQLVAVVRARISYRHARQNVRSVG